MKIISKFSVVVALENGRPIICKIGNDGAEMYAGSLNWKPVQADIDPELLKEINKALGTNFSPKDFNKAEIN